MSGRDWPAQPGSSKKTALLYASWGWAVFPIYSVTKTHNEKLICTCKEGAECGRPGKHPFLEKGVLEASTDRLLIEKWFTKWPTANIAVATGKVSGITVIDADASKGKPGVINLTTLAGPNGGLPNTPTAATGGGGLHLFFAYSAAPELKTGANILAEAIDVRNDGGYVILPPSKHISGGVYSWTGLEKGALPELQAVPPWMLPGRSHAEIAKKRGRKRQNAGYKFERVESMLMSIDPDDRDKWLGVGVILGRLYIGTGMESDAWALYERWASRSDKFDEDRAGNINRMKEAFHERSQDEPRAGGQPLGVGSIIKWAKEAGWNPFGDRVPVDYEPGNEMAMAEALAETILAKPEELRHFNVMGQMRDVLKAPLPLPRFLRAAYESGKPPPDSLVVRVTTPTGLLGAMMRRAVMRVTDKDGAPQLMAIPGQMSQLVLAELAHLFPPLSGVAEWPMVGENGELISKPTGYDPSTGFYFDIDRELKVDEKMKPEQAWKMIREELLCDFPFEEEVHRAAALGMLLAFMQRPLMKTCPAFSVVAPQPGSGKSTLVEVASLAVHGVPVASHAWSLDSEELRKAIHSVLLAKIPAVLFDNISRGQAVTSDHLAKLLTSEVSTDRTLGASETRKEVNNLLVAFTGNNITFIRDLASRVINIRLNPKMDNPLRREFKHSDIRTWVRSRRSDWISALIAIARAKPKKMQGNPSRFEDFDAMIVKPVFAVTGMDIRGLLEEDNEQDAEEDEEVRALLTILWRWQQGWRGQNNNGKPWSSAEVVEAVQAKTFDEAGIRIVQRGCGNPKAWEQDPVKALSYALRAISGSHRFAPLILESKADTKTKTRRWVLKGGPKAEKEGGF